MPESLGGRRPDQTAPATALQGDTSTDQQHDHDAPHRGGQQYPAAGSSRIASSAELAVGPVAVFLGGLDFLDDRPNKLPGASYTAKVGKNFSAKFSMTRNTNAHKWMYYVGTTWSPS